MVATVPPKMVSGMIRPLHPYSRDAQGIERSLREVLGTADGKYVDDLYQEQDGAPPKGLVADLLNACELVKEPGIQSTTTFENLLLGQKERLLRACSGSAEFGGWFNKFLKASEIPSFLETQIIPSVRVYKRCCFR